MTGAAVFMYGMLVSFIFSGSSRNARLRRPNPPMMQYVGYVLCGISAGVSVALMGYAGATHLGVALI